MHKIYKPRQAAAQIASLSILKRVEASIFPLSQGRTGMEKISAMIKLDMISGLSKSPTVALVLSLKVKPENIFFIKNPT